MEWNLSEKDYPIVKISESYKEGLSEWLARILELAQEHGGKWNVLIADLWPNEGHSRLIGHVQKKEDDLGLDTGYRVCARLSGESIGGEESYEADFDFLESILLESIDMSPAKEIIDTVNSVNPFEIRLSTYGEGPIARTLPLWPEHA